MIETTTRARAVRTTAALLATALLGAGLSACGRTFVVEVHNDSSKRVLASMHPDKLRGEDEPLDQRTIAPGAVEILGPATAPTLEFVELSITPAGGMAERAVEHRLSQGKSTAFIEDARATEFGVVRLRVVHNGD